MAKQIFYAAPRGTYSDKATRQKRQDSSWTLSLGILSDLDKSPSQIICLTAADKVVVLKCHVLLLKYLTMLVRALASFFAWELVQK